MPDEVTITADDGELCGLIRAREAIKSYVEAQGMYAHACAPYEKCVALINEIIARDFGVDSALYDVDTIDRLIAGSKGPGNDQPA